MYDRFLSDPTRCRILKKPSSLLETKRQPYQAHFNLHRHPRISPAVYQVTITGPYAAQRARRHAQPPPDLCVRADGAERRGSLCPADLSTLMRRAYRRPVTDADLNRRWSSTAQARAEGDFDAGIEMALSAVLVNPQFLFRVEQDPPGVAPQPAYRICDLELASRLSFFLWSSIPDDELLDLAERGELSKPESARAAGPADAGGPASRSLVTNFADQWLHLRNLESITPDLRLFPDFDDNLRQAFRQETELFFESVMRDDRSVLDLLGRTTRF